MSQLGGDQVIPSDPMVTGNSTPPRSHGTDDTATQFATVEVLRVPGGLGGAF